MGNPFGGSKTSKTESKSGPSDFQAPYLTGLFDAAQYQYTNSSGPYMGNVAPNVSNASWEAGDMGANYSRGTGTNLLNGVANASQGLTGLYGAYGQNALNLAGSGIGELNSTALGTLTSAAGGTPLATTNAFGQSGQSGLYSAFGNAGNLYNAGISDNTGQIMNGVNSFYNADQVAAAQKAARDDITNTLSTQTLPSLNAQAVSGGNLNSARAGAAESVARGEAARAIASSDANISTQAWNSALSAALNNQAQQNALALGANSQAGTLAGTMASLGENQRQFDASQTLSAAGTLGNLDLNNRTQNASTQLAGNAQLGSAVQTGIAGAQTASNLADANASRIGALGDLQRQQEAADIANAQYKQTAQDNYNWDNLMKLYQIQGSQQWGQNATSTNTQTSNNSLAGTIAGLAATGAAAYMSGGSSLAAQGAMSAANSGYTGSLYSGGANSVAGPGAMSSSDMMNAINNGSIYSQNPNTDSALWSAMKNTGSRMISGIGTAGLYR